MRTNKIFLLTSLLTTFVLNFTLYAQSDYVKTQNFKTHYKQIEEAIKNTVSLDECSIIGENIAKLKSDFADDKALLDKSLYPDNFESSFVKIEKALEIRKADFTQIVELTTEVGTLKTQVTELSQKNETLLVQIKQLNLKVEKDASTIASLQKLVAQLKANIQQRDLLVRDIVDSLLAEFVKAPSTLNEAEKQSIYNKVETGNLFYNVERTISDNVQFMKVTQMTPDDLSEMKQQYKDFNKVWTQIGPKLASVYLSKREKVTQIANIDNMFAEWNARINEEMWSQVNKLFREKQVALLPFKSGDQFVNSVDSFVDNEIKNMGVKRSEESENTFFAFTDSVYFKIVQPTWIPILIENNMMTEANKDTIEVRIAMWKEKVAPEKFNWIYLVLGLVIVALAAALILKGKKKQSILIEKKGEE